MNRYGAIVKILLQHHRHHR